MEKKIRKLVREFLFENLGQEDKELYLGKENDKTIVSESSNNKKRTLGEGYKTKN